MDPDQQEQGSGVARGFVRRVLPWIALIAIVYATWTYLGQYRSAVEGSASEETSGTVEATAAAGVDGQTYVRVLNDGLNLRADASTTATVLKTLKKDQQLVLVEKGSSWYKVQDADGTVGWVAAGGRYTVIVAP